MYNCNMTEVAGVVSVISYITKILLGDQYMSNTSPHGIHMLVTYDDTSRIRFQTLMNAADVFPWLTIHCMTYTAVNCLISRYTSGIASSTLSLLSYTLLLIMISRSLLRVKNRIVNKDHQQFVLPSQKISAFFIIFLLLNAVYLFSYAIYYQDEESIVMAITNVTLYVGFAVSTSDLFSIDKYSKIIICFFKPFQDLGITYRDWWKLLIVILITIFFAILSVWGLVFFGLVILLLFGILILSCIRKRRISAFCRKITPLVENKCVLVWQIGGSNAIYNAIKEAFPGSEILTPTISRNEINEIMYQYDIVIILNSIWNHKNYSQYIDCLAELNNPEILIIDPFIHKNKRNTLCAWIGLPLNELVQYTATEYIF